MGRVFRVIGFRLLKRHFLQMVSTDSEEGGLEELAVDRNWYSGQRDVAGLVAIQSVRTACVIEVSASVFDSA